MIKNRIYTSTLTLNISNILETMNANANTITTISIVLKVLRYSNNGLKPENISNDTYVSFVLNIFKNTRCINLYFIS